MIDFNQKKIQKQFAIRDNESIKNLLIFVNKLKRDKHILDKSFEELKLLYEITHPVPKGYINIPLEQLSDYYYLNKKIIEEIDKCIENPSYNDDYLKSLYNKILSEHEFSLFISKIKKVLMKS